MFKATFASILISLVSISLSATAQVQGDAITQLRNAWIEYQSLSSAAERSLNYQLREFTDPKDRESVYNYFFGAYGLGLLFPTAAGTQDGHVAWLIERINAIESAPKTMTRSEFYALDESEKQIRANLFTIQQRLPKLRNILGQMAEGKVLVPVAVLPFRADDSQCLIFKNGRIQLLASPELDSQQSPDRKKYEIDNQLARYGNYRQIRLDAQTLNVLNKPGKGTITLRCAAAPANWQEKARLEWDKFNRKDYLQYDRDTHSIVFTEELYGSGGSSSAIAELLKAEAAALIR